MKPILLLVAVYTLIYQQYRKRINPPKATNQAVMAPLPQPTPANLMEADTVALSSGSQKSLTTAAFIQVLPVR